MHQTADFDIEKTRREFSIPQDYELLGLIRFRKHVPEVDFWPAWPKVCPEHNFRVARQPASNGPSDHSYHCQCRIISLTPFGEVIHRIEAQIDEVSGVLRALCCRGGCFQ